MEEILKKYRWLGENPIVEDHESHWRIYSKKDTSPLILSKDVKL